MWPPSDEVPKIGDFSYRFAPYWLLPGTTIRQSALCFRWHPTSFLLDFASARFRLCSISPQTLKMSRIPVDHVFPSFFCQILNRHAMAKPTKPPKSAPVARTR